VKSASDRKRGVLEWLDRIPRQSVRVGVARGGLPQPRQVLDAEQVQATRKEDLLNTLSQMARRFRTRVGESLPQSKSTTPRWSTLRRRHSKH